MRKYILAAALMAAISVNAQVTYLQENFDVACAISGNFPSGWAMYNPVAGTAPLGAWQCTAVNGRKNASGNLTPGMDCTGVYSSAFHNDTSYLVTPLLNISAYPGNVYLHFDTKTDIIHSGGKLSVILTRIDSVDTAYHPTNPSFDLTSGLSPLFSNDDITDWVTHEADLTPYKSSRFYIAFRYTAFDTSGTIWYLDNVNTSTTRLDVPGVIKRMLPMGIIANTVSSCITIAYNAPDAGIYRIVLYDMLGRDLYKETISSKAGWQSYTISGPALSPGMYFIRMGDSNTFGVTKVMVQ